VRDRPEGKGQREEPSDELASILDFIRPGDELVVVKLDCLGRNTRDVLNLELDQKGRRSPGART